MKTTKITKLLGAAMAAAILLLNGCGGGGGGGDSSPSTPTTPTTPVVTTPTVTVTLTDVTSGATTNSISLGSTVKATATVLDGNKKPVANAIVGFAIQPADLITISPASASILSDANGLASVQLSPASISSAGAGTITATSTVDATSASGSVNFSVGAANVGLSGLSTTTASLSPYGTTGVTVTITGVPTSLPVTVEFTSICASSGKATLTPSVQSVNGVATANYTDNKCATTDTITATVAGTSVSSSIDLMVVAPLAASIQFISATPETIVLKGTGSAGFQEASLVKFKVVDNNNQAVANAKIKLYLSLDTGGILLDSKAATSLENAIPKTTTENGEVQVSVQSGTVPTSVWVIAKVEDIDISTQSNKLTISTGRPAQDRFSLSRETFNIEGLNYDGETTNVTARASDRLGNPVPDGTTINFIAGGAQIAPSCQTIAGACSVTFSSGNPRLNGSIGILAYTVGEESFDDSGTAATSNNNIFDPNEPFTNLGNAFLNADGRGASYDSTADQQIIFDPANLSSCGNAMPISPFAEAVLDTCDNKWGSAHVRGTINILLSGSFADSITDISTVVNPSNKCISTTTFTLKDVNGNAMPFDTSIAADAESLGTGTTVKISPDKVPNSSGQGTEHSVTITRVGVDDTTTPAVDPTCSSPTDLILPLTITTPKKNVKSLDLTL